MNLDAANWNYFILGNLIEKDDIYKAKAYAKIDLTVSNEKREGLIPFISRTEDNNSVDCYVPLGEVQSIEEGNAITVGDTTSTISYQPNQFATGDHIIVIRAKWLNVYTGLFIVSLLRRERYRYSYGRAFLMDALKQTKLLLPAITNVDPDWEWIEAYTRSLHHKPITTKIVHSCTKELKTDNWKEFLLHRIMNTGMGNGIDAILTTSDNPKYNYVSRDSKGNGVVGFVDEIEGEKPFPAGAMSLALGGSFLGSCFIQKETFYTAQNVAVLQEKIPLTNHTNLFIATLIRNECKIKYQAFGRELNAHFRKDFTIKLPVKYDENGIVYDNTHEFSDDGYIPDWEWMDNYMKSLPYSDRI